MMRKLTVKLSGAIYLVENTQLDTSDMLTIETFPNGQYLSIQHKRERIIIEFSELEDLIATLQEIKNETTASHH